MTADELFALSPVIPVAVVEDARSAVGLARALEAAGVPVLEVTLRTPGALEALAAVRAEVPGVAVGAGTVLTPAQAEAARAAGAEFLVSPGCTPALLAAQAPDGPPLIPGVVTPSEVMLALEHGLDRLKLFPAASSGGPQVLAALAGPFAGVRFCPTGGISLDAAADYLSLPNVACIGASWLADSARVRAGDWAGITAMARQALARLGRGPRLQVC